MTVPLETAQKRFEAHFGQAPSLAARAPGRVNIIGEHTDYNDGFVLPMAIERDTLILARPRTDRTLNAYAANLERTAQTSLEDPARNPDQPWMDYIVGVARELIQLDKPLSGADLMILGDVPLGAGLSSSASLEMAALKLFELAGNFTIEGHHAPKLGQRVENEFLGLKTGIMDQFIVRMARPGHALFLDCRDHQHEHIPIQLQDSAFVIANTGVSRGLAASKYNERVNECQDALRAIQRVVKKDAAALRDCNDRDLEACREHIPDNVYRRARHVITENARTQWACDTMRRGDMVELGRLMSASDDSLRKDYEVTCPELDTMTEIASELSGCYGSRMTGAGFGGCTVSLVVTDAIPSFCESLAAQYLHLTGHTAEIFASAPAGGASQSL